MIYNFPVPRIIDTKNIKKVFANPNYVTQENLENLNEVVCMRKQLKLTLKKLKALKPNQNSDENITQQVIAYAEVASKLEHIFDKGYKISKNFKWSPILSSVKILKFSKDIRYGKSGEMIMALYCAFSAQLKEVQADLFFIKNNFAVVENEDTRDTIMSKVSNSIKAALEKYVSAFSYLKHNSTKLSSYMQTFALEDTMYIETQGASVDMLLACTKINANVLYIESLRHQSNYEEIAKYSKSIVIKAVELEAYVKTLDQIVNREFAQYVGIVKRLYLALALWSLFQIYLKKVNIGKYESGENFNLLAGACSSFTGEIRKKYEEIININNIKKSEYFPIVEYYFESIILPKTLEVEKVYGETFKGKAYETSHFANIKEKDYISSLTTGISESIPSSSKMLSPSKICTNCAPVIFEYYQKGIATQTELLRMRDEVQRLSFTRQLGTLKDVSDAEISASPQGKYQMNSRISGNRPFMLNLAQKESSRLDKQASLATTATIARSFTPSSKLAVKPIRDYPLQQKNSKDILNIKTFAQPAVELVSPLERIRDFESQVNKKVDTFKKKLREEIAKSSAKRPSHNKLQSLRPKTTAKMLRILEDNENRSAPKVSVFSPAQNQTKKNPRASPIEFKLTPKQDRRENTDKGSAPSRAEWTVGTNKENRMMTAERGMTQERVHLDSSIKKIKDNFKKELEKMTLRSKEISSPEHERLQSPFFSPLRASELRSPQNGHHLHGKPEEAKKNYAFFIKPDSTPLLDSLMSSPREKFRHNVDSTKNANLKWAPKSPEHKASSRSNYYKELFHNSLESPSPQIVKRSKAIFTDSDQKDSLFRDEVNTLHESSKLLYSQSFNKSGKNFTRNDYVL